MMDAAAAIEVLDDLSEGHRIAIETEEAVIRSLQIYEAEWDAARDLGSVPMDLTRRIRQLQESKGLLRRWKRELDAYEAAIVALRVLP